MITLHTISLTDPLLKHPLYLIRYIDDIFGIFTDTYSGTIFLDEYRKLRPDYIKLTSTLSTISCNVLDITIYKDKLFHNTGVLQTTLYQKPHNRFLFIPPTSFHDNHNWIRDYVNRIRLICSEDVECNKHTHNLYCQLCNRAHTMTDIQKYFTPTDRLDLLRKVSLKQNHKTQQDNKPAPLVFKLTRTPRTNGFKRELNKVLEITKHALIDPDTNKIFNKRSTPLLCIKRPKNISDILVRATIKPNH